MFLCNLLCNSLWLKLRVLQKGITSRAMIREKVAWSRAFISGWITLKCVRKCARCNVVGRRAWVYDDAVQSCDQQHACIFRWHPITVRIRSKNCKCGWVWHFWVWQDWQPSVLLVVSQHSAVAAAAEDMSLGHHHHVRQFFYGNIDDDDDDDGKQRTV